MLSTNERGILAFKISINFQGCPSLLYEIIDHIPPIFDKFEVSQKVLIHIS